MALQRPSQSDSSFAASLRHSLVVMAKVLYKCTVLYSAAEDEGGRDAGISITTS